jgi:Cu(I)/Ag(I) efflux system membrane protein CusA/SilA
MVDLGIILSENILRHTDEAPPEQPLITTVYNASTEVSSAILTAVSTTIVSFLPVFTLQAAEGKLFGPLAYTKTFALVAALIITLFMMPAFAHWLFSLKTSRKLYRLALNLLLIVFGIFVLWWSVWAGTVMLLLGVNNLLANLGEQQKLPSPNLNNLFTKHHNSFTIAIVAIAVSWLLATEWMPLGVSNSLLLNFIFIALILGLFLGGFQLFIKYYPVILNWCLDNKKKFLLLPVLIILLGVNIWLGFDKVFGFIPKMTEKAGWNIRATSVWSSLSHTFPGLEKEFMPALDEGSFLLMPTSMPHSGVEANIKNVQQLDMRVQSIPEVEMVVGKAGRVESALDPAPVSMFENIILYKTEYINDENGYPIRFKVDKDGQFVKDEKGELIKDKNGQYFRQWRDHIKTPDDIWNEIVNATNDIP